ncbi:DNA polymerase III subunit gamma/tau [Patescibacteria group bacterium]|nr:DNA polymerase III subunit gamma/tau [Patescibacteria group bacterium]
MTVTFYLKHRPQAFKELDCTQAREELIKIFKSGKYPHAFLFSGPRGIGKTSAARIVAKSVNCLESKDGFEPCNECKNCLSITHGTNMDVFEIDAASNRGIDDIKELREKIKLSPSSLKYKVYIIDEVHMLTTEAFNALLKTLEEPPGHAIFVLCTTDPEKLPKTVVSRCQRINFKSADEKEITERLKKICELEKIDCEEKALKEISRLAQGGFRDAVKILGQVSVEGKVTLEEVKKTAGVLGDVQVLEFLSLLEKRNTKEALVWLDEAVEKGVNLRIFIEELLNKLRTLLLEKYGVFEKEETQVSFDSQEIKTLIEIFSKAYFELKYAVIPALPLEMAVIEWLEETGIKNTSEDSGDQDNKKEEENKKETKEAEEKIEAKQSPENKININIEEVVSRWPEILGKVKPLNHSVQALLKASRPLSFEGDFLILEVFYKFHKDQLETQKCRQIFEKTASEILNCDIKLKCTLKPVDRPAKPLPIIEEKIEPVFVSSESGSSRKVEQESGDDIIKLAEEIFN